MEIQTFAEQLERWRRGEENEALEVKIKAIKRTGRTHARLWKHITAVVWREVKPWIDSMVDEAKDGGIPMEGDAPDISGALMRGVRDAVEVGYRQGKQTVREIQKKISLADDWHDVLPAEALDWIQGYVPELARVYEADVLEKVRDQIAASLRAGKTEKHVARELRQIQGQVEKFSRHRLEAIARTESMRGYNMGHLRGMIDSKGVAGVEFSAILDSRTSEPCQAREGLRFPLGSPELVYNSPPLHPNCRSVLIPVMDVEVPEGWKGDPDFDRKIQELPSTVQRECDIEVARKVLVGTTQVQVPEKIIFVPAKTIQEANEFAEKLGIASKVDYDGMGLDVANAFNERLLWYRENIDPKACNLDYLGSENGFRMLKLKRIDQFEKTARPEDFPASWDKKRIRQFFENQRENARNEKILSWGDSGAYSPGEGAMVFNVEHFQSVDDTLGRLKRQMEDGWWPRVNNDAVVSVLDHEMGHAMDFNVGLRGDHVISGFWEEFESGLQLDRSATVRTLSNYAANSKEEFVAEAWAEYINSDSPRNIAEAIGSKIFELVKK